MTNKSRRLLLAVGAVVAFSPPVMAESPTLGALADSLARTAPTLSRKVLNKALAAMQCAASSGVEQAERLAVIDFSLPSTAKRLWIFDLQQRRLVLRDLVAHGQKSGENYATRFSNVVGSYRSSLGLFRTEESYFGRHGYSLRMDGLEPGAYAYFHHSFYCAPADSSDWLASTDYGLRYASVVGRGSLFGVQFHPEKSQSVGLHILRNFVKLTKTPTVRRDQIRVIRPFE